MLELEAQTKVILGALHSGWLTSLTAGGFGPNCPH